MDKQTVRLFTTYLRPFRRRVLLLAVLLVGSVMLQLFAPQIIRRFLDAAEVGSAVSVLLPLAGLFFVTVLSQKALALFSVYASEDLGWGATNRLRVDLAEHTLRLDMGFHKLRTPGELIERIDGDVGNLARVFSQLVVQVVGNVILAAGILFLLLREDWRAGLIGVIYGAAMLGAMRLLVPPVVSTWRQVRQSFAELFAYVEERIVGTEDIRGNGAEGYVMAGLYPRMATLSDLRVKAALLGGVSLQGSRLLHVVALVLTLTLAATSYLQGQMTIGTVFLLAAYISLLQDPLTQIRRQIDHLQQAIASTGRIAEFFAYQPQVQERARSQYPTAAPTVAFSNVSFAYRDRPAGDNDGVDLTQALEDVTFTLPAGKILGVLGRTGSGKTTLTRLLFRLYDTDRGAITLDGVDVRDVSLADLRAHVGLVTQDVQLFAATIRDNLTLFSNYDPKTVEIDDAALMAAIEALGLGDWFGTLPDGLDTTLSAGGQGLSAGEAQLLALARLFLRNPHLIVLDEASSRLDPETERRLERAIERLLVNRTGIIIAHRLETLQRVDDILIVEDGHVREHGARKRLAADPDSRFSELLGAGIQEVLV